MGSLYHHSGAVTYENYQKITAGMTRAEVEKLLGGPPGDYSICGPGVGISGGEWWSPRDPKWISDECEIIVRFKDDGRVATGFLSRPMAEFVPTINLGEPGVLDRFERWISSVLEGLGL
jgi:hypothetical protein